MASNFEMLEGPPVLDPKGLRALLAAPDKRTRLGKRDAALIAILGLGGLRAGECASIKVCDLQNGDQGVLRIRLKTLKRRNHWRVVSLPLVGSRAVRRWFHVRKPKQGPWLFPGAKGNALTTRAIEKLLARYFDSIGRPDLHLHSLRHSALSLLMRATGDLYRVQRMAGHASPTTTAQAYLSWSTREADENAAAMAVAISGSRQGGDSRKRD